MNETIRIPVMNFDGAQVYGLIEIDDPDDLIQKRILETKDFYERPLLDALASFTAPGGVFIDVGANIGNHSVYMGVARDARIIAIEPNQANFRRLQRNLELSMPSSRFTALNCAVGAEEGHVRSLIGGSSNTGGAKIGETTPNDQDAVPLVRLDKLFEEVRLPDSTPVIIKIDVEGMEADVFSGMEGTLVAHRPAVVCEINGDASFVAISRMLKKHQYFVYGCFLKVATLVFLPVERLVELASGVSEMSWKTGRSYVHYCDVFRANALTRRKLGEIEQRVDAIKKILG